MSVRVVNELNRDYFRERLVENFYIRSQNNDVSWPRSINNVSIKTGEGGGGGGKKNQKF